ncbi:ABC transporter ATP-binding protein [Aliidongia dinghuensis]|uniref:ABC transporter ATP-binding protein n=1 Tax=Aliidongia dinghuensis TaxID=1867774 RepID=A0A8J2YWC5_9PROT|nr:ABC transporter ATP-binding protein [Aliidongia dinghuensis]GGF30199.1 ABC transporter ATP-binding protein [Aliidongia dinghuensis]
MMLELEGLSAGYGADAVLHDVDIQLNPGEIVTLIGANGAGKSTLVNAISGLIRPFSGQIRFEGQRIEQLAPAARLRLGIAHVPEGRHTFAGMTVAENLRLGAFLDGGADWMARARKLFRYFPVLEERFGATAGNFSGGQQQMLAIARGLMSEPKLLMLDEPSLGLSPLLVSEIFKLVRRLRDEGLTILLVEQNARQALQIADRGYVIENGRVTLSGTAEALIRSKDISERYLGIGARNSATDHATAQRAERLAQCLNP